MDFRRDDLPQPSGLRAVAELGSCVTALQEAALWSCTDTEMLAGLEQLEDIQRRLDAARMDWLAEAHHRGAATATGATSTAAWLIDTTFASPGRAYAQVRVATALTERYPALRTALAEGAMSAEQAQVCVTSLDKLPAGMSQQAKTDAEAFLVEQATRLDARRLAITGKHLRRVIDPDAEDRMFQDEQKAREHNWFSMYSDPDRGGGRIEGWLDAQSQAQLNAALRPLSGPMAGADGLRDDRTPRQRRGDALAELARRACNIGDLPDERGQAPHLLVTITLETLDERIKKAQAYLEDGTAISAAEARRIACDARLIPVVLGSAVRAAGRRPRHLPGHRRHPPRADRPRRRLRPTRLRPPRRLVRRPPHHAMARRRGHQPGQHRPAVRGPSPAVPRRRLDHPNGTRPAPRSAATPLAQARRPMDPRLATTPRRQPRRATVGVALT